MVRHVLVAAVALAAAAPGPARAQVDWSGGNRPVHGSVQEAGQAVTFTYQVYDAGRTEAPGRAAGLGAAFFHRDADAPGAPYVRIDMAYARQSGFENHDDLFEVTVPAAAFGGAARVEYFTVAYDSTASPVHADTTRQDADGAAPPFVFTFGQAFMPHSVYAHFSVCANGLGGASMAVRVDARNGTTPRASALVRPAPVQIPDLWEGDVFLPAGVAQTIEYGFLRDGVTETDAGGQPILRRLTMQVGSFLQGRPRPDSWGGGPLGCYMQATLAQPLVVHFSVCLAGVTYGGGVCVSGDVPELGGYTSGAPLARLQPGTDLFEGDVLLPAGSPAVVRYKFRINDCFDWEDLFAGVHQTTNRALYLGGAASPYVAPTAVWANSGPNFCPPPTRAQRVPWTRVRGLYR